MQNARDSFYIALRNRLATLNPARTIKVRGVQRPSLLVEDAEAPMSGLVEDVFVLRWTSATVVEGMPCTLMSMGCEIHYATSGTQANAGSDRGRTLCEMDRELLTILQPLWTAKFCYSMTPPVIMQTNVFWTEPELSAATIDRNTLKRVVKLIVYAFEELGDL